MHSEKLEDLGISRPCLEFLRAQSISDVPGLISSPADILWRRPTYAAEIATALGRLESTSARELSKTLAEPAVTIPASPSPTTPLEFALTILRRRQSPMTLKHLKDEVRRESGARNLASLRGQLEEEKTVIFYPFGSHQWVGLRDWGENGSLSAARGAWKVLPAHLDALRREQRTDEISLENHGILHKLAQQEEHRQLLRLLEHWPRETAPVYSVEPAPIFTDSQPAERFTTLGNLLFNHARNLPRPFSLCQLRAEPGDLEWLKTWASKLEPDRVVGVLESTIPGFEVGGRLCSLRDCFGLLVMLLASEVARREAREGQVWNVVHPCFPVAVRSVLFVHGQPRAPLREALESACLRFQLHHAFSLEGAQAWYQSIFLQFGFTHSGIKNLPSWLAVEESEPVSVSSLRRHSPVFAQLWQSLLAYRKHRSQETRNQLLEQLCSNPYVLKEWKEEILQAALQSAPDHGSVADTGEDVAYPHLLWPSGSAPHFAIQPVVAFTDLCEPAYVLLYEDEQLARLYKELEGYVSDPDQLIFRPTQERVHLTLVNDANDEHRELELQLWDPDALFSMYSLDTGERLEALKPGVPCALLLAQAVEVEPAAECTSPCGKTGFYLHRFDSGISTRHHLRSGDQELSLILQEGEPDWATDVQLLCYQKAPAPLPSRVIIDLLVPEGVQLRWIRFGRQTITMTESLGGYNGQLLLQPDLASTTVRLHMGLERAGKKVSLSRSVRVKVFSITSWLDGHWQVLNGRPQLSVSQAREGSFRCFTGESPHRDFALLEGDMISTRARPGTRSIGRLGGFGGTLRLLKGPFNADDDGVLLVREVINPGILRGRKDGRIELTRPVDADELHSLVWWDGHNDPFLQPAEHLHVATGAVWEGWVPPNSDTCAVGLAYDGVWMGAHWGKLCLDSTPACPANTAGMLRWLHVPILRADWLPGVKKMAHAHALAFLESWLVASEVSACEPLRHRAEPVEWNTVVREVFRGWIPTNSAQSLDILKHIGPDRILRVSPFLLVRLIQTLPRSSATRQQILEETLLHCPSTQHAHALSHLECEAALDLGVDTKFVQSLVQRAQKVLTQGVVLNERERLNLGLATNVASFRRLVAARLLM